GQGSPRLKQAMRSLFELYADPKLARAIEDIVAADEESFAWAEKIGMDQRTVRRLHQRWLEAQEADADDPTVSASDRLRTVMAKLLRTMKQNPQSKSPIPQALADDARRHVTAALQSTPPAAPERAQTVERAKGILGLIGDSDGARELVAEEIKISPMPYFYMSQMGYLEAARGHTDQAIAWFERAYRESKGTATRFQWGVKYVQELSRLRAQDEFAIREATIAVLGELQGPGRIYGHTRSQLAELEGALRNWNADDQHAQVIAAIRGRMADICAKVPSIESSAHQACASFPADGKHGDRAG
ncbi:MAG: hypothetical protein ACREXP_26695, partial [Steroidobacteraceae bacterium]